MRSRASGRRRTGTESRRRIGHLSGIGGPPWGPNAPVLVDGPRSNMKDRPRRGRRKLTPAPSFGAVPAPCRRPPRPCRSPRSRPASLGALHAASGRGSRRRRRARRFYQPSAAPVTVDRLSIGAGRRTRARAARALGTRSHLRAGSAAPSAGPPALAGLAFALPVFAFGLAMLGRAMAATGSPWEGAAR